MLPLLGLLSIAATVGFSIAAALAVDPGKGQTVRGSLVEAWTNVAIGFSINYLANFALLPLIGAHVTAGDNFWLGCIYTAISVLRSFAIRRWFNGYIVALVKAAA